MRILITGGSGYIGSRVMRRLAALDEVEEIVDVDLAAPGDPPEKVRYVERSVTEDLRDLFADPSRPVDLAMHLAWLVDPLYDEARQREVCIGGTNRFLDGCVAGDVRHVFFMSSATAYGARPGPARFLDESEPLADRFHFQYSAEKREAEGLFARFAADRPGTLLQVARPCVVGGPHVSNFIFRLIDKPLTLRPLGFDPELQLVHEDDCADAVVAILEARRPGAYNVAAGGTIPLSRTLERVGARAVTLPLPAIRRVLELAWRRRWRWLTDAPPGFAYFVAYPWLVSNRRLTEEVGFRFRHTTEETLEAFLAGRART